MLEQLGGAPVVTLPGWGVVVPDVDESQNPKSAFHAHPVVAVHAAAVSASHVCRRTRLTSTPVLATGVASVTRIAEIEAPKQNALLPERNGCVSVDAQWGQGPGKDGIERQQSIKSVNSLHHWWYPPRYTQTQTQTQAQWGHGREGEGVAVGGAWERRDTFVELTHREARIA
jgi:hypothetical protein